MVQPNFQFEKRQRELAKKKKKEEKKLRKLEENNQPQTSPAILDEGTDAADKPRP